jgi:hypothetical protein
MADQLCTTAQVKSRLRITDAGDDALFSELIDQVSDWIQDKTKRRFVPENAATYVVDTIEGSAIEIRRGIRAVTTLSVALTDQPDAGGTYTAVLAADILLRPVALDRRLGAPATWIYIAGSTPRLRTVINGAKIVGDFGYAVTPPEIVSVAIDAVAVAYQARGKPASAVIGSDGRAIFPWATYFTSGSPQSNTLARVGGVQGVG